MKILSIVLFALLAKIVVPETTGTEQLDLNDIDRNDSLWMKLFARINTVLNETNKLAEGQIILNKRLDTQELKLAQLTEISFNHTVDLNKSLDGLERKLTDFKENTEAHLTDLKKKLDAEEQLSKQYYNHMHERTSILRRQDGSVDFYRNWTEYQKGFGNPDGEFFIGLERLHAMTSAGAPQELIVILRDFENHEKIAKYDLFRIGNEAEKYAIKQLGTYSGDAGDSLSRHKGSEFSTYDQNNDINTGYNCAEDYKGAWWFRNCYDSHLFGPYKSEEESNNHGVTWADFNNNFDSLKFAEMKIRPKNF